MAVWQWLGFAAGILLILGTFSSVMGTLVVPRALSQRAARLTGRFVGATVLRSIARLGSSYEWRDRVLAWNGPLGLVVILAMWVSALLLGFTLMFWPSTHSFGTAFGVAGSSLFTLGTAPAPHGAPTIIMFVAAASGLIIVALEIAYLPVLYGAFNRREQSVTLLDSAGQPSWGVEILARSELNDSRETLGAFYSRWEAWAADVAESHSTYAVLMFLRSPKPLRHWLTGLLSVMDAAALEMSITPLTAPANARTFLRMGRSTMSSGCETINLSPQYVENDPGITREEFDTALEMLEEAGWELETTREEAWSSFCRWRSSYAHLAYALANICYAPPAMWSGPRTRIGKSPEPIMPYRDPAFAAELRELTKARRERRHREQHEHLEHHNAVHADIHRTE